MFWAKECGILRSTETGVQGAALKNLDVYRCETGQRLVVNSLCLENKDAANTIAVRMGIVRGGMFYVHKTNAAVAAGASLEIDRRLLCGSDETVRIEITPSGANTDFAYSIEAHSINIDQG